MTTDLHPEIVLIGVEPEQADLLSIYLSNKYQFIILDDIEDGKFDYEGFKTYGNIYLFIVNTDRLWLNMFKLVNWLKNQPKYQNIPVIGLSLKRHFDSMKQDERILFEDLIALPCNCETFLNKIEIWIQTYDIIKNSENKNKAIPRNVPVPEITTFENFKLEDKTAC